MNQIKILMTGVGRSGKDASSEYLQKNYGLTFVSSSEFVGQKAVYPILLARNPDLTWDNCFVERHQNRALWYNLITEYNTPNLARLGTELFAEHDIYCGLRNINEFNALRDQNQFDLSIWIDADERLSNLNIPLEPSTSLTITQADCDITIQNNDSLASLHQRLDALMSITSLQKQS